MDQTKNLSDDDLTAFSTAFNEQLKISSNGKLKWQGSLEGLQALINRELGLQTKWSTPIGGSKLFENDDLTIRWYTKSFTLTIKGKEGENLKHKLASQATNDLEAGGDDEAALNEADGK